MIHVPNVSRNSGTLSDHCTVERSREATKAEFEEAAPVSGSDSDVSDSIPSNPMSNKKKGRSGRTRRGSGTVKGTNTLSGPLPKKTLQLVSNLNSLQDALEPSQRRELALRQAELKEEQRLAEEEKRMKENLRKAAAKSGLKDIQHASAIGGAVPNPPPPMREEFYHFTIKILLLGDSGVGKTSLMNCYAEATYSDGMIATAGVDFKCRNVDVNENRVRCQIWDTAGQERFHCITRAYYKGAHGLTLVYDVTDNDSFKNVSYWIANIEQHADKIIPRILIANKIDLESDRVISTKEGEKVAEEFGLAYYETSAKDGTNVEGMFFDLLSTIVMLKEKHQYNQSIPQQEKSGNSKKWKYLKGSKGQENCVLS